MSTQERGSSFPNLGAERSWSFQYTGTLHSETGVLSTGLYYMNQNAKTGDIFIGGENQRVDEIFVADDAVVPEVPADNLRTLLPTLFSEGWERGERPKTKQIWSGIMGFTADAVPIVGKLEEKWTQRPGDGEWIAAGFNGYGMDKCWLIGEGLTAMMVGEDISEWFPEIYRIDGRRFHGGLKPEMAWEQFIGRVDNSKS
jgi:glycine/D-amino acid oxidase-like deaminating enzyme